MPLCNPVSRFKPGVGMFRSLRAVTGLLAAGLHEAHRLSQKRLQRCEQVRVVRLEDIGGCSDTVTSAFAKFEPQKCTSRLCLAAGPASNHCAFSCSTPFFNTDPPPPC
eukprot:1145401-Pelagomonas_calceolata.AAC.21